MSKLSKQLAQTENVGMLRNLASSFHKTTRMDFEDLFSESIAAYYEAKSSYDPNRGCKESTYLYQVVQNHLRNYTGREIIRNHRCLDVIVEAMEKDTENKQTSEIPSALIVHPKELDEFTSNFSGKAAELVHIILDDEYMFAMNRPPRNIRKQLINKLRELGWTWTSIWSTLAEVKSIINQN